MLSVFHRARPVHAADKPALITPPLTVEKQASTKRMIGNDGPDIR